MIPTRPQYRRSPQLLGDVVLNEWRSGGSQRYYGSRSQYRQVPAEHAVVRPEIMTPLRDAMRLVDGDQGRLSFCKHLVARDRNGRAIFEVFAYAKKGGVV